LDVVGAAGKTGEALLTKQDGEGVDANCVAGGSEFLLHVLNRETAFAHSNRQITDPIAGGSGLRSALRLAEEESALLRLVAEPKTQDAEGPGRVAERAGDVGRRFLPEEVSTECFVLTLQGELRR
jgi:hypothetical protein